MNIKLIKQSKFTSFDGSIELIADHQRPDRYRHLDMAHGFNNLIPRGGGLSFSAASFGDGVLVQDMQEFDRFLEFDSIKNTIKVEAGVRIGDLTSWAIARGLYFPILPGYPNITIGGCVAADVHGKNPWKDGTFSDRVLEINIHHSNYGEIKLSKTENSEIFNLTCGGFGTTGVIINVTLQLVELISNKFDIIKIPVCDLYETIQILSEKSNASDFIYSWHDGTRRGKYFGSGMIFIGTWNKGGSTASVVRKNRNRRVNIKRNPGIKFQVWNKFTLRIANRLFMMVNSLNSSESMDVEDAIFPLAKNSFYHRLYGKRGFAEMQVLVGSAFIKIFTKKLQILVDHYDPPLAMMSLKMFSGRQKSLSMSGDGYLIALNFFRTDKLPEFLGMLDELCIECGAQPNLSKDSRISRVVASQTLPYYLSFKAQLDSFDPLRVYRSNLIDGIGL